MTWTDNFNEHQVNKNRTLSKLSPDGKVTVCKLRLVFFLKELSSYESFGE